MSAPSRPRRLLTPNAPPIEDRADAARSGEEFLPHRVVHHRLFRRPRCWSAMDTAKVGESVHEVGGAIERIDDPHEFVRAAPSAFLGEDPMVRVRAPDCSDDFLLGVAIDIGDEVIATFACDLDGVKAREARVR